MAGSAPKIEIDSSGLAVTILVTSWHSEITDALLLTSVTLPPPSG